MCSPRLEAGLRVRQAAERISHERVERGPLSAPWSAYRATAGRGLSSSDQRSGRVEARARFDPRALSRTAQIALEGLPAALARRGLRRGALRRACRAILRAATDQAQKKSHARPSQTGRTFLRRRPGVGSTISFDGDPARPSVHRWDLGLDQHRPPATTGARAGACGRIPHRRWGTTTFVARLGA